MSLKIDFEVNLPASKSESNRALIIQALAEWQSGAKITLHNLSEANDTKVLQQILQSLSSLPADKEIDAQDAGTTFRFLTAFLAITGKHATLTGTPRMQERPIGVLVEALRTLGANIEYAGKDGFPPLRIAGFSQKAQQLAIQADVSSQYISALLLIAPVLPQGLSLQLVGKIASKPYIEMTLQQMKHFGIKAKTNWEQQTIDIAPQTYLAKTFTVESDWSAAGYWYSAMALLTRELCPNVTDLTRGRVLGKMNLLLKGLREDSLQGDKVLTTIMPYWSIKTDFVKNGAVLSNVSPTLPPHYKLDFSDCPDLAQTIIALISHYIPPAGPWQVRYPNPPVPWSAQYPAPTEVRLREAWRFVGLESLRIKETDRLQALQNELAKFGIDFTPFVNQPEMWFMRHMKKFTPSPTIAIDTYHDHRMAMSFAPIALHRELDILNPEVVVKSYPHFWDEWNRFREFIKAFLPTLHKKKNEL